MKFVIALLCLVATSFGQTYRTVTAETNNVIRTNFTMPVAQVSGALATNGSAAGLTNFPASLLRTNGDGSGLTNLPNANLTNATGILPISNGGTGATNAALAISNLLPPYSTNTNAVLALNSNATALVWTTNTGGGGGLPETPLSVTNGGTGGTNLESALLGLGIATTNNGINLHYNAGTNYADQHIVIGSGAWATSTNATHSAVAIGANSLVDEGGVAIGKGSYAFWGVAIGDVVSSEGQGISIGTGAGANDGSETNGGVGIGYYAYSQDLGIAVGTQASAYGDTNGNGSVAIGVNADAQLNGVAIGSSAYANADSFDGGVAVGFDSQSSQRSVAIGPIAIADGIGAISIGASASSAEGSIAIGDSSYVDPLILGIQIGSGTNTNADTIQFWNAGGVTTNSWTALANSTALGHSAMAATIATNAPANTNAPSPDAWMLITEGTNNYYLPLWQ